MRTEETLPAAFDRLPRVGLQGAAGNQRVAAAGEDPARGVFSEFAQVFGEETVDVRKSRAVRDVVQNDHRVLVLEDLLVRGAADKFVRRIVALFRTDD